MGWWPVTEGVMTQLLCVDSVKFFLHMAMTACKSLTFLRERKWETRNGVKLLFAIFPSPALSWSSTLYAIIVVNVYASFPFFLPAFWCPGYYPGVAGEIEEVSLEGARDRDQYERKGMTTMCGPVNELLYNSTVHGIRLLMSLCICITQLRRVSYGFSKWIEIYRKSM